MCNDRSFVHKSAGNVSPGGVEREQKKINCRVLLVDDHPITRRGVRQLISQQPNFEVCGEAGSAEAAVQMVGELRPDVAIVDISLSSTDGLALTRNIRCFAPQTSVLILTMYDELLYAEESMRAGAQGLLTKCDAPEKIATALEHVSRGDTYYSPQAKQKILRTLTQKRLHPVEFAVDSLSARELDVLRLTGDGYTPMEIAKRLGLSRKTIDSYREHLRDKLGIVSSNELVRYAIQWRRTAAP